MKKEPSLMQNHPRRRLLAVAATAAMSPASPSVRDRFLGVWKLVAYERRRANGAVDHPYSQKPVGRITYDSAGRMSAQLMRPGRRCSLPAGVSFATGTANDAEVREAVGGFVAYFGTFDVDESSHTVIHHVEACLVPSWVGHDLKRSYRFEGNRLLLSAVAADFTVNLTWQRDQ